LSVVHHVKASRDLQFDDNARIDDEIDALSGNCDATILNCNWPFALEIYATRLQLEAERLLVNSLKKSWP
jgi:hypothetical protein